MAAVVASKLKLLHLARIFERQTDAEHGLTSPQLIEKLAECGVSVERKTLYRDIECLRDFGYDIVQFRDRRPVEYGLATRAFQEPELLLLADAVQSSRFLTKTKSDALVRSVGKLGSEYMARALGRRIHVEGRIKSQNESVYYNIDGIQRAMDAKRKVEFKYFKYNERKERVWQRDGAVYAETPVQLMYVDDEYYLVVWNDKHADFATYRVDRMKYIEVSEQEATRNERIASFKVDEYRQRAFGMYGGKTVDVILRVQASAMSTVVDRFGGDVPVDAQDDGTARVCVRVMEAPTFYGWLATLGTQVSIEEPQPVREAYAAYLRSILALY